MVNHQLAAEIRDQNQNFSESTLSLQPSETASHCDIYLFVCESDQILLLLTRFSALHEVDEHVVDARSLCQHQRLEKKNESR